MVDINFLALNTTENKNVPYGNIIVGQIFPKKSV